MSIKFTKEDRQFLLDLKVKDAEPEMDFNGSVPFNAVDMQARYERLKQEGRIPSLANVLRVVRESEEPKQ